MMLQKLILNVEGISSVNGKIENDFIQALWLELFLSLRTSDKRKEALNVT